MKRGLIIGAVVVFLAIALILIVELKSNNIVTGNVASSQIGNYKCIDSDGNLTFEDSLSVKGNTTRTRISDQKVLWQQEDKCTGRTHVKEYYCTGTARINSVKKTCVERCVDGVCV